MVKRPDQHSRRPHMQSRQQLATQQLATQLARQWQRADWRERQLLQSRDA